MYATDFIFDGVSLSSKGYMICSFDGDSIVSGGEIEPIVKKTPATDEYTYYAAEINNVLTWELGICKLPCGTEDFEPLNQYEESELAKWLLKTDGYRWLQFVQPDDYPDVYYKVYINMSPVQIGGQTFGYNLTITSNCGYGFSGERTYQFSSENQPLTINVDNDLNRYIYPTVSFETNADECWIYNENDLEQNLDNGKESHFYNLGDNFDNPIELSIDSGNDIANGIDTPDQFNFRYLRLVNGENNIYSHGTLASQHRSTTNYSEITLEAPLNENKQSATVTLEAIHSESGINVKNVTGTYELSSSSHPYMSITGELEGNNDITVPNDNYDTLIVSLKQLVFRLETKYNYVYLQRTGHRQYILYCSDVALSFATISGNPVSLVAKKHEYSYMFDKYTITLFDDPRHTDLSTIYRESIVHQINAGTSNFYYVPVEIKHPTEDIKVPVTTLFIPRIIDNGRETGKLFEMYGLPGWCRSQGGIESWMAQGKRFFILRQYGDNEYVLVSTTAHTLYYLFSPYQNTMDVKIRSHGGVGIQEYTYSKTNKTWTQTQDGGGLLEYTMGINGFIGDIVYVSPNLHIQSEKTNPENYPIFDSGYNKWEIYTGGEFITGGNDKVMQSVELHDSFASNIVLDNEFHSNEIFYRQLTPFNHTATQSIPQENVYIFNPNNSAVEITVQTGTHSPARYITIPSEDYIYIDYATMISHNGSTLFAYSTESHTGYTIHVNNTTSSVIIPVENQILKSENVYAIYETTEEVEQQIYTSNRKWDCKCDITGISRFYYENGEFTFDQYDWLDSEQNGTIKFREIRRVLV